MILDEIFAKTRANLEQKKAVLDIKRLEKMALQKLPLKRADGVLNALKKNSEKFNIIAEIKKASPSKGVIRTTFEPLSIAKNYAKNGAAAISVLTEPLYFGGSLDFLERISCEFLEENLREFEKNSQKSSENSRNFQKKSPNLQENSQISSDVSEKNSRPPLLRKDFICDEYQLFEALNAGADFVLLIARAFDKNELKKMCEFALNLGLETLCEVHNESDLDKAHFANANIIGINHRNLSDFSMDMSLCERLLPRIDGKIIVAESGLNDKAVLRRLDEMGVDAFLIGEYFMRQKDEGRALADFVKR